MFRSINRAVFLFVFLVLNMLLGRVDSIATPLSMDVARPQGNISSDIEKTEVVVKISNLHPQRGTVRLALYGSQEDYERRKSPVRSAAVPVRSQVVTVKFTDLPEGWYAIMFYHDVNNNGKFDTILGLPKEQFGFSNNAVPGLSGPPSFEKVKFFLPKGKRLVLTLKAQ